VSDTKIVELSSTIDFSVFQQVDVRVGVITAVDIAEGCRIPAYKLKIDFGTALGTKQSLAQIRNYAPETLIGKQVLAVMNLKPRQIGENVSEVLTLGVPTQDKGIALITPDMTAVQGGRLF